MKRENIDFHYPDESFYLSYREVFGNFTMKVNHFHNQYELYYLLAGERYYFIKDRVFRIQPGNLVMINAHDLHKTTDANTQNHIRILINFSKDFLPSSPGMNQLLEALFVDSCHVVPFLPADQQYVETVFNRLIYEAQSQGLGFEISLQSLLMELLVYTRRYIEENQNVRLVPPSPMHEKISEIVQYINQHYGHPLSLPGLSKKFFISQYHLSRTFKQTTGFTVVEYINNIRIREAQRLLRETNLKVIDIAEVVGFKNVSHFGRVFKNITNYSPLLYKRQNR